MHLHVFVNANAAFLLALDCPVVDAFALAFDSFAFAFDSNSSTNMLRTRVSPQKITVCSSVNN